MNTATSTTTSNRIAAGVTAAYLRDLTRRPAPARCSRPPRRSDRSASRRAHYADGQKSSRFSVRGSSRRGEKISSSASSSVSL